MRMPADNDMKTSCRGIQVERMDIMKNIEENFTSFGDRCFGQTVRPVQLVNVSAHSNNWSQFTQRSENFRLAHIAGVKNQLRSTKSFQCLRTQQPVSV